MRPHPFQEPLTGLRRRHAARGAGEQPDAEPFLELANSVAESRWRYSDLRSRPCEAPFPRNCQESDRSEEHTSELQSLMRISYAVFCLKKKKKKNITITQSHRRHTRNTTT